MGKRISTNDKKLYEAQNKKCFYCNRDIVFNFENRQPANSVTRDHVFPYNKGWHRVRFNQVFACPDCNSSKNDKMLNFKEIQKVCELYEKANVLFDPCYTVTERDRKLKELSVHQYYDAFVHSVGLSGKTPFRNREDYFCPVSETFFEKFS